VATADGGKTWGPQSSGTSNDLTGIACPSPTTCFAVGYGGTILAGSSTPPATPTMTATSTPTATPTEGHGGRSIYLPSLFQRAP
jgi:hypothetical protein